MATFTWPGSSGKHTISYAQHQANVAAKRAQPAAPAPAAAPAAPAGPFAMPVDPAYDAAVNAAAKVRDTSLANVAQGRSGGLLDYGYNEDPVSGALTFDPNNAFSKAMLLKKTYDQSRARTAQQIGSTGGLYAGAAQKAQDLVNIGQVGAEDSLQKSLIGFLGRNTQARANAGNQYLLDVSGAEADRLGRIAENPLYQPDSSAAGSGGGMSSSTSTSSTSTSSSTSKGGVGKAATKTNKKPANVATGKGSTPPYSWHGSKAVHSITEAQHKKNVAKLKKR